MPVKLRFCSVLLAVTTLAVGGAWADIMVDVNPVDATISDVGLTVTVDIVADIPEADAILVWGLDLDVADPGIADWTLVSIGPLFNAVQQTPDGDLLGGLVPQPGNVWGDDILLATVEFAGYAVGITGITLGDDYPTDVTEGFGLDPTGFATVVYGAGTVEVLPEPATLSLMALAGLALLRRR
ncbi:MAG: PEP-CTERM sorting domain-containing protein [Planctomycetes bacterium]|nr:PEP-CTERM sorting domain-containing protein [Planctomycetota bacterium]